MPNFWGWSSEEHRKDENETAKACDILLSESLTQSVNLWLQRTWVNTEWNRLMEPAWLRKSWWIYSLHSFSGRYQAHIDWLSSQLFSHFRGRGSSWKTQLLLGVHLWLGLPRAPKPMMLIRCGLLICTWLSDLLYVEGFCWVQEILQHPAHSGWSRSADSQLWVFHGSESFPLKQNISEATPLVRSRRKYSKGGVH